MSKYRNMEERLIANSVVSDDSVFEGSRCWLWIGSVSAVNGYARMNVRCNGKHVQVLAHRKSHETFIGPIPEGYDVDHRCKVRHCIAPLHLEAKTVYENRFLNENNVINKHQRESSPFTGASATSDIGPAASPSHPPQRQQHGWE